MSTRILLLRHAQSADPTVFHGAESDVDLSPLGRRQAQAVAAPLAARRPVAVVSSGMLRARETARPIALACGLSPEVEPALHERRVGPLGGTPTEADGPWPATLSRWTAGDTAFAPDGAESFDAIRERVVPAFLAVAARHAGRTAVVVAHGIVCKVLLLALVRGHTPADWHRLGPVRNVAVYDLAEDGGVWRLEGVSEPPEVV